GYHYNGKVLPILDKVDTVAEQLPSLQKLVIVPILKSKDLNSQYNNQINWEDCLTTRGETWFEPVEFNHPLYIMFSSGTTGKPKCIVHGTGGSLLQHRKEHVLHTDLTERDVFFYFTTCGWMMWNWLVSGLATGCTLVLFDGSPSYPSANRLTDLIDNEKISVFGTSAKFIAALEKAGSKPIESHSLASLKTILSTGSPLLHENFRYIYNQFKQDVCLASISGGTDILSCFVLGNPTLPVFEGEIQCAGLGMDVQIYDELGTPIQQEKGELVCRKPFPSCPIGFWNDPNGEKFHSAYFSRFPNIWAHGDYGELTAHGGFVIHGRSDAVLNPGGVRIGTAEIYRQVEKIDQILECLAVGQKWDGDER
ncbi:MAG TPA: acetoacetate--CoA ligase, partial [Pseudomonadales bacterium]|nr:acetoacetate--CoA ligase [Pseudomonadales bacterium]